MEPFLMVLNLRKPEGNRASRTLRWLRKAGAPWLLLAPLLQVGCSKKLDKETAEKLLNQTKDFSTEKAECVWRQPSQETPTLWTYPEIEEAVRTCARQLSKKELVELGGCYKEGCTSGCCARRVNSTMKSKIDAKDKGLSFTCGRMKLLKVVSITTEGNKAKVKYEREVVLDPLVGELSACLLEKPEAGVKERERDFVRDDAGVWSITER